MEYRIIKNRTPIYFGLDSRTELNDFLGCMKIPGLENLQDLVIKEMEDNKIVFEFNVLFKDVQTIRFVSKKGELFYSNNCEFDHFIHKKYSSRVMIREVLFKFMIVMLKAFEYMNIKTSNEKSLEYVSNVSKILYESIDNMFFEPNAFVDNHILRIKTILSEMVNMSITSCLELRCPKSEHSIKHSEFGYSEDVVPKSLINFIENQE